MKTISDAIGKGEYRAYFPGLGGWHTHKSADEEIRKITKRMAAIPSDPDFRIPVLGYGKHLSLADIKLEFKKPNLTKNQRANLQRGRRQIDEAKELELQYWRIKLAYHQFLARQLVPGPKPLALGAVSGRAIGFAIPAYHGRQWDAGHRTWILKQHFQQERNYYDHYYALKIAHLNHCLAQL